MKRTACTFTCGCLLKVSSCGKWIIVAIFAFKADCLFVRHNKVPSFSSPSNRNAELHCIFFMERNVYKMHVVKTMVSIWSTLFINPCCFVIVLICSSLFIRRARLEEGRPIPPFELSTFFRQRGWPDSWPDFAQRLRCAASDGCGAKNPKVAWLSNDPPPPTPAPPRPRLVRTTDTKADTSEWEKARRRRRR